MKFTQIPTDTFENLQLNAGVLLSDFTPSSGTLSAGSIIGATSGGVSFSAVPSFTDFGEDIDNCPKNMKELKRLDSWEVKMSGTFLTVDAASVAMLSAAADVDTADTTKVVPRNELKGADFKDVWWVGDYSDKNGAAKGGFVAIHMMNTLSTGGFSLQSGDKAKGQFGFEFTAHYSNEDADKVPFEVYVKAGEAEA